MTYTTIDLNKMGDKSKIYYMADLLVDLREYIEDPHSMDITHLMGDLNKAIEQYTIWANNGGENK